MNVEAIKTHRITAYDSLWLILDQYLSHVKEEDIIVITSKILSIMQGRVIEKGNISKKDLIYREADLVLEADENPYDIYLTIKHNILIPTAGIDESNVENAYVLYPKDVQLTASKIWKYLRKMYDIERLGVVITDSHTTIMRRGVTGIALGWCGFEPLYSYIGKPDLYNQPLKVTQINLLDSLATSAVYVMGEGAESSPIAIIKHAPKISFLDRVPTKEEEETITISIDEDLYAPLLRAGKWGKGLL
jgi:dihydrofolate synthase / folylpolyglutamate synthase